MKLSGVPVTTPDRTLLDLADTIGRPRGIEPRDLERALDHVLLRRMASRFRIAWTANHSHARGRRKLLSLLAERGSGYVPPNGELEALFLRRLREAGLPPPDREEAIDAPGFSGRVDFIWPAHGVAVETDGYVWHGSKEAFQRDRTKRNLLTSRQVQVFQVTWEDLMERPEQVVGWLAPLLAPDPRAEEG